MRIERLEYRDKDSDWHLAPVEFFPDLTLLVGVSGVGKTRILEAIRALKQIAEGAEKRRLRPEERQTLWGVEWDVTFSADNGSRFVWSGEFERRPPSEDNEEIDDLDAEVWGVEEAKRSPRVQRETLSRDGKVIIDRTEEGIVLNGKPTPKLSSYESVLSVLREEDVISVANEAFRRILFVDYSDDPFPGIYGSYVSSYDKLCEKYATLEAIRNSDLHTKIKLAVAHKVDPPTFQRVAEKFSEVFPQVQEVAVRRVKEGGYPELLQLRIRERGVGQWIPEHKISSGMRRTLMHLSRMLLWPDGTVILVDEFENSLDVNCIDFVTQDLVHQSHRLQFIITSHHPYIINSIDARHWMIVCRDGPTVSTHPTTDLGLDDSSHESFIKLLNLPQFQQGIATG